jgi:CHASE1-domain containing sensor protein
MNENGGDPAPDSGSRHDREPSAPGRYAAFFLALTAFAASGTITFVLLETATDSAILELQSDFNVHSSETIARIEDRLKTSEQVLRGAQGLFVAENAVDRTAFRSYVETLKLDESYPGIQGVAFSVSVPPERKVEHEESIRSEGFPEYSIRPPGTRDTYTSIIFIEPFRGRNLNAFGYDMYSEPVRRSAMDRARDTGAAALSG